MSSLFAMLQAASQQSKRERVSQEARVAKQKVTLLTKKKAKWAGVFKELGNKAGTNALAGHMGRASASILKSMYELEELGWVTRAGVILKAGRGKNQIIWEWML